jgi:hypothetical protein
MNRPNQYNRPQTAFDDKPHNPNPFDFVPFAEHPITRSEIEFEKMGEPMSGYLELQINALTPIHVVGSQKNIDPENRFSTHYRQNGEPCIPAATIRGCLRAFIEALTSGWVSQATPEYEKVYEERHRGYATFEEIPGQTVSSAINPEFKPKAGSLLDVASYLFGLVVEKEQSSSSAHSDLARKSRVWIEDAYFANEKLDAENWLPDLKGEAFMGGAKASASSWWYMRPFRIEPRPIHKGKQKTAEFWGEKYRGRKFYFHQTPEKCIKYYDPANHKWPYSPRKPFLRVGVEALKMGENTSTFRVYVSRIPRPLLELFVLCLFPGQHIRHKLGYGKAYGYGSFEFVLKSAWLRVDDAVRIPPALTDDTQYIQGLQKLGWSEDALRKQGVEPFIDRGALNQLAVILTWDTTQPVVFTYPPFAKYDFQTAISYDAFLDVLKQLDPKPKAADFANALYPQKRTIDFRLYQERSNCWAKIMERKP